MASQLRQSLVAALAAMLLVFLVSAVAPLHGARSLHPPDAHSSLPHQGTGLVFAAEQLTSAVGIVAVTEDALVILGVRQNARIPGSIGADPPDHPPR